MKDNIRPGLRVVAFVQGRKLHGTATRQPLPHEVGYLEGKWLVMYDDFQGQEWHLPKDVRPERFTEYLTLPTGFGRTNWWSFGLIQTMCFLMVFLTVKDGEGQAIAIISAFVVEAVLVTGTFMNFKGYWR